MVNALKNGAPQNNGVLVAACPGIVSERRNRWLAPFGET
jgi:hypothetical protein